MQNLSEIYTVFMSSDKNFMTASSIALENSSDRIWLIGGAVYRNLAHILHGTDIPEADFDFIIEKPKEKIILPKGWVQGRNRYGNAKFLGSGFSIDFVPLENISSILRRKLAPTIENYLTGTPLTVQSIAYDIKEFMLIGDAGIKAIMEKSAEINNKEQAQIYASKKGISIEEMIKIKSESLGFKLLSWQ